MPLYTKVGRTYTHASNTLSRVPVVRTFYADDSACEIAGRKHTIVGAIEFADQPNALGRMLQCKRDLGIGACDEIKWNSGRFTRAQRDFITDSLIPVLGSTTGFVVIVEGTDKQASALRVMKQLSDYSQSAESDAYVLVLDKNIVQNSKAFDLQISGLEPCCMGWSEVDSQHNPLIQFADLFCGFQKLRLDFGTGRADPSKLVSVEFYEGETEQFELGYYLFAGLRHSLWGKVRDQGELAESFRCDPFKHNLGYGVRVFSSVEREPLLQAVSHLGRDFMGCIH